MTERVNFFFFYTSGGIVMKKGFRKTIMLILILTIFLVAGCNAKEDISKENKPKETVAAEKKDKEPRNPEQILHDFVLKNTKIVHILSISKKINEQQPDLGPFDVISGIDERGLENEVWIKDMKIHEITSLKDSQTENKPQ
jgi:predicted small secreted protein